MPYGVVLTFGKKALTVQTPDNKQYYVPFEDLDESFVNDTNELLIYGLPVKFDIDYTRFSGKSNGNKRYYAKNIVIEIVF